MKLRLISGLLLLIPGGLVAQQAFEVASIKPANPDQAMSIARSGNRLTFSNYSLEMLILWAYDIRSERLLGAPKGWDSARYDIVAIAPPGEPVAGRLNLMMQSMLAERFPLVVHKETRELPFYVLVADKNGPKIHVEQASGPVGQNPFAESASGHLTGSQVSAAMLAKVLTDQTGRLSRTRRDRRCLRFRSGMGCQYGKRAEGVYFHRGEGAVGVAAGCCERSG